MLSGSISLILVRRAINKKDKINKLTNSYVVYQFRCPECNSNYIGKTERNLCVRLHIFNHISDYANYQYIKKLALCRK